jgi:hypothetical protein
MPTMSALRAAVTGPAADAIGPNGQIQLAAPPVGGEHELTASEAVNLATAWTRERGPMTRGWLEQTHGAALAFNTLETCGRPLYARSAFNAPPANIPSPYRRAVGPWWLVTFCDDGGPSLSVAVSAWATELTVESGKLRFPRMSGTEIFAVGVPVGHVGEYPMSPEMAVEMVAQQAGKRVTNVPELVIPLAADGPPQLARWRLALEGPTTVRTKSGTRATNEVFTGPTCVCGRELAISVAELQQPEAIDLNWRPAPQVGESEAAFSARSVAQTVRILRHPGTPVRVESISAWGN